MFTTKSDNTVCTLMSSNSKVFILEGVWCDMDGTIDEKGNRNTRKQWKLQPWISCAFFPTVFWLLVYVSVSMANTVQCVVWLWDNLTKREIPRPPTDTHNPLDTISSHLPTIPYKSQTRESIAKHQLLHICLECTVCGERFPQAQKRFLQCYSIANGGSQWGIVHSYWFRVLSYKLCAPCFNVSLQGEMFLSSV